MNLVVVSNRVSRGNVNEPITGGLAAALLPVVEKSGAIWVGSSGRVREGAQKEPFAEVEALGTGALAMLDLPAAHYGGYYEGFANSALWPALHSRADLIRASQEDYLSYREVNVFMARALLRFKKPDTVFWVQDYHFLALGAELRELGVTAAELARQIDVPVNRVTSIINGQRGITADTALRLAHWFGTTPQFWMNLQQLYELRRAENEVGGEIATLPRRTGRPTLRKVRKTA